MCVGLAADWSPETITAPATADGSATWTPDATAEHVGEHLRDKGAATGPTGEDDPAGRGTEAGFERF